jgi:selenocysteine-specific translation elongation factor
MARSISNLEDEMRNLEEREARDSPSGQSSAANKTEIGIVDRFFDKAGVAAVVLSGELDVGDIIEFEKEGQAVRQRVESMQIERQDVSKAYAGDSVGIKTSVPIEKNSRVYKLQ